MSHFTVMVIGDNVEEQLAPYQENNMGDCPANYLEFNDKTEEVIAMWNSLEIPERTKESIAKYGQADVRIRKHKRWENGKPVETGETSVYHSIEELNDNYFKYDKENGRYGYYDNPNAKWDWYQIGGRWAGFFKLKNGANGRKGQPSLLMKDFEYKKGLADQARKKDIDFEGMFQDSYEKALKSYREVKAIIGNDPKHKVWEQIKKEGKQDNIDALRNKFWSQPMCIKWKANQQKLMNLAGWNSSPDDYLIDEETFAKRAGASSFVTYSYLHNKQWHAMGDMGWFGFSSNEGNPGEWEVKFFEFLKNLPDNTLLTVVDCHI